MKIYMDLDAIFDTRATIVRYINPTYDFAEYDSRKSNSFEHVSERTFKELYRHRNFNTILESRLSNVLISMVSIVSKHILSMTSFDRTDMKVIVDTSYYDVPKDEIPNLMKTIKGVLPNYVSVEITTTEPSMVELSDIDFMFKFDGAEWINSKIIDHSIYKSSLVNTILLTPRVSLEDYEYYKASMAILINVSHIPVVTFSEIKK